MSQSSFRALNLPYLQHNEYWLSLFAQAGTFPADISEQLAALGCKKTAEGVRMIKTDADWHMAWARIYEVLERGKLLNVIEVEINNDEFSHEARKSVAATQQLATSLWLGRALMDDRLVCYFQPVMNRQDKIFGYESFARVRMPDGSIMGGDKIIAAAKALGIEFAIDRQLHVQAIKTFAQSDCTGFLFVNFFPGFIHRPAVYLEGLGEAAKFHGIVPKHLVLELTRAETQSDLQHLKMICEFGRSKGYSIALDDIATFEGARKLVAEIRPDFVKLDMQAVGKPDITRQIVELVHQHGGTVIGEGVETTEAHEQLKGLGVDLFQGYLFSPPAPVVNCK